MANTYSLISTVTVGAGNATSINFTNISSSYTDLQLLISVRSNTGSYGTDRLGLTFNSDTGSNYNWTTIQGYGSYGVTSQSFSSQTKMWVGFLTDSVNVAYSSTSIYIPNYASSNQKSVSFDSVAEDDQAPELMNLGAGLWTGTAAISSISIFPTNLTYYNFNQYSMASLYGIKKS